MTTPRCVGCDQWKGGKRWRGRGGCPIPPGWQRTMPLRDPPVDHSTSTLICILCYKQWGHLKETFRETGQLAEDGTILPGVLPLLRPIPKKKGGNTKKRLRDSTDNSSDTSSADEGSSSSDNHSQKNYQDLYSSSPHSPASFSSCDTAAYGSRPASALSFNSSTCSSPGGLYRAQRKGTPSISVQVSPRPASPLLDAVFGQQQSPPQTSSSAPTNSFTQAVLRRFNCPSPFFQSSRIHDSRIACLEPPFKRVKVEETA